MKQSILKKNTVKDIQSSIGIADNRPGKSNLPPGIQVPQQIAQSEGKTEDTSQVELAIATTVSGIKAINPQSLEEAMKRPDKSKWTVTIQEKLENIQKAGTWIIVERPKYINIVKNKWVFRIKKNAAGKVEHYKARLVAKGFTQVFGIDYYDTWPIDMFNFHSAFLNSDPDKEVYMEQPQGYKEPDRKQYFCKLLKSSYRLKQAGIKWYDALCRALTDIRFR